MTWVVTGKAPSPLIESEFNNFRRNSAEVAEADPPGAGTHVNQARPTLPITPVGKLEKVELLETLAVALTQTPSDVSDDLFAHAGAAVAFTQIQLRREQYTAPREL